MTKQRIAAWGLALGVLAAGGLAGAAGKGKGKAEAPAAKAADKDQGQKPAEAAPGKTPLEQTQEDDSLSLQEKQYFAKLYEEIAVEQKYANESCGIEIVGEYEKASTKANMNDPRESTAGLSTYARAQCTSVLHAIARICVDGGDVAKRAVQKAKLKRVICKVAPKGPMSLTVGGGVLNATIDLVKGGGEMEQLATGVIKKKI